MSITKIYNFIEQVKQEVAKVTWPSRKETMTSTMTVIIMVTISSFFFLLVDMVIHKIVQFMLGIGN